MSPRITMRTQLALALLLLLAVAAAAPLASALCVPRGHEKKSGSKKDAAAEAPGSSEKTSGSKKHKSSEEDAAVASIAVEKKSETKKHEEDDDDATEKKYNGKSESSEDDDDEKHKNESDDSDDEEDDDDDDDDDEKKAKSKSNDSEDDDDEKKKKSKSKSDDSEKKTKSDDSDDDDDDDEKKSKSKSEDDDDEKKSKGKSDDHASEKKFESKSYASKNVAAKPPAAAVGKPKEDETAAEAAPEKQKFTMQSIPDMIKTPVMNLLRMSPVVKTLCTKTEYPELCESSIGKLPVEPQAQLDGVGVLKLAVEAVRAKIAEAKNAASEMMKSPGTDKLSKAAISDCLGLYDDMNTNFDSAVDALKRGDKSTAGVMLDSARTDVDTCENGFTDREGLKNLMADHDETLAQLSSNVLAINANID